MRPYDGPLRCGEIDAAPRVPPELFQRRNGARLQAYIDKTIELYPTGVSASLEQGRCSEVGYNVPAGSQSLVSWDPNSMMRPICEERCDCTYGSAFAATNCQNQADKPREGTFCSLCQFYTGSSSFNDYNALATIDFYREGAAPSGNHLYFYYVNQDKDRCGEVDAAPYMPAALFEPRNVLKLAAYVEATVRLYSTTFRSSSFGSSQTVTVQLGRCESVGYSQPQTNRGGSLNTADAQWIPTDLMGPTCNEACNCRWQGQRAACHGSALRNPNTARLCSLPYCDAAQVLVDDPMTSSFCSLCDPGSAFAPSTAPVTLYDPDSGH